MIEDGASSHKIDIFFKDILSPKGHQNCINGSKDTALLLKGWILPVGRVVSGRVCVQPSKQDRWSIN